MPESSCLHIQDSASGPIRVVEIPWLLVRVGCAPFCEVRLNDDNLAAEVCRLLRRGGAWQIEPIVAGAIEIDGRAVDEIRPLPFDMPVQIGPYCLTLHPSKLAAPDWGSYQSRDAISPTEKAAEIEPAMPTTWDTALPSAGFPRLASSNDGPPRPAVQARPSAIPSAPSASVERIAGDERPISAIREQQRWESRWRAAGEKLRAGSVPATTSRHDVRPRPVTSSSIPVTPVPIDAGRPASHAAPQPFGLNPIPLKERVFPRAPVARTTSSPSQPSGWTRPTRPEHFAAPAAEPGEFGTLRAEGVGPLPSAQAYQTEASPMPPACLEADAVLGPVEASVDERISAWESAWFDRQAGPDEIAPGPTVEPSGDDESRFVAGTQWVAPAECSGTISTCFEDQTISGLPTDFVASTCDEQRPSPSAAPEPIAPRLDRERRKRKPRPSPGASEPIESIAPAATRQEDRGYDPEPTRPGRLSLSSSPVGRVAADAPLSRPIEASPRVAAAAWPSVDDILAAHRRGSAFGEDSGRLSSERKPGRGPILAVPSLAREPECWELPLWLGWPPLAFVSLLIGALGCLMAWSWTLEARSASIVTNRLLGKEAEVINGRPIPLPEWVVPPPKPTWYLSTARHLTNWAAYLGRSADSGQRGDEIRELLEGAVAVSPAYAPARLALARIDEQGPAPGSALGLALGRDSISLAWSARKLLKAGRKEAAFPLFRRALLLATRTDFSHETLPKFADDPQSQRYLLPGEDVSREIVAWLASDRSLEFSEWSAVLPEGTVAPLVAARLLKEQSRRDSEASLDMILGRDEPTITEGPARAVRLAVRAEAFALRGSWKDAEREYRAAIEGMDHDATRRSWWFNLADVELRLKDAPRREEAIKEALASVSISDDIARRASDLRRGQEQQPLPAQQIPRVRSTGLKAN